MPKSKNQQLKDLDTHIEKLEKIKLNLDANRNLDIALMYGVVIGILASFTTTIAYREIILKLEGHYVIAVEVIVLLSLLILVKRFHNRFRRDTLNSNEIGEVINSLEYKKTAVKENIPLEEENQEKQTS